MTAPTPSFTEVLGTTDSIFVLDGGLGTLLESRGHDLSSDLWSARLLIENPAAIRAVHRDYFLAGAHVAISSSYQVSYDSLARAGFDSAATTRMLGESVRLALDARDELTTAERRLWVAASVGPYGATLADGSEYRGDYGLGSISETVRFLREWHRPRLEVLAASGADVLAIETIPSLAEVEALAWEVASLDIAAWVSVTSTKHHLRDGEPLADAWSILSETPRIVAMGVNCLDPADTTGALSTAHDIRLPLIAYPNSGERWDAEERHWHGSPDFSSVQVQEWRESGARLIGGCCRTGPAHITAIAAAVEV